MLSGTVFIDRSNNKSAVASMQQAGEDMKRKRVGMLCQAPQTTTDEVDIASDLP